jgi:hypothetical protein
MRILLILLHLAGAGLSLALLLSTWHAKPIIVNKARAVAVEKCRKYSDPIAGKVQETLDRQVIGKLIRGNVRARLEEELGEYRASPGDWLSKLALGGVEYAKRFDFPEIDNPLARKALDAIKAEVAGLKARVQDTYDKLIADIRLFATTNLVVFLIAAILAFLARTPKAKAALLGLSVLLLVVAVVSASCYIGQNWSWALLQNDFMGWDYPLGMGVATLLVATLIGLEVLRHSSPRPSLTSSDDHSTQR